MKKFPKIEPIEYEEVSCLSDDTKQKLLNERTSVQKWALEVIAGIEEANKDCD